MGLKCFCLGGAFGVENGNGAGCFGLAQALNPEERLGTKLALCGP